jgi:hypothetical protein
MNVVTAFLHELGQAWPLWLAGLRLDPDVGAVAPGRAWIPVITIAVVAAVATMVGQSVVLFANRVRGWALGFSLLVSILGVLGTHLAEGLILWGLGTLIFTEPRTPIEVTKVVILSSAPLAFGFLTAIPLLGPAINRLLSVWSLLVLWAVVSTIYAAGPWAAAGMVLAAWLGMLLLGQLLGPVLAGLRDRVWRAVTGRPLHPDTSFLLALVADPRSGAHD